MTFMAKCVLVLGIIIGSISTHLYYKYIKEIKIRKEPWKK